VYGFNVFFQMGGELNMQLVKKSNDLIQAKYSLTKNEQRLILYLVSKITREDADFQDYVFTYADLADLTEISKTRIYVELKDIAKGLLQKPIVFQEPEYDLICNWCSSFKFIHETSECIIRFDPNLKPFLLQLKKYFTSYNLKYVTGFTSKHSFRIYELCKQYENLKKRKMSIVELKAILELENKYKQIGEFKKRVINPAIKDINTYSDLVVSVKYAKTRRHITHIEFNIHSGLEHCQNEKQEAQILQNKKETAKHQAKVAEIKKAETGWSEKWEQLSEKDRKKWGGEGKGFIHFRAKKGAWPGE